MVNWWGGQQIKERGGVSLWEARKQPPVILLARQKHCGMLSNTTSDLHVFGTHTHTLKQPPFLKQTNENTHEHTLTQSP